MCVASGPLPQRFIPLNVMFGALATTDSVQGSGPCVVQSPPWIFGGAKKRWTGYDPHEEKI